MLGWTQWVTILNFKTSNSMEGDLLGKEMVNKSSEEKGMIMGE